MKKSGHPDYQDVLFVDSSNGYKFVCGSTFKTAEREEFEGKEYPVCRVAMSSASHPFFTGSKQFIDAEGRMEKFANRYKKSQQQRTEQQKKQEEAVKEKVSVRRKKKA